MFENAVNTFELDHGKSYDLFIAKKTMVDISKLRNDDDSMMRTDLAKVRNPAQRLDVFDEIKSQFQNQIPELATIDTDPLNLNTTLLDDLFEKIESNNSGSRILASESGNALVVLDLGTMIATYPPKFALNFLPFVMEKSSNTEGDIELEPITTTINEISYSVSLSANASVSLSANTEKPPGELASSGWKFGICIFDTPIENIYDNYLLFSGSLVIPKDQP